MILAIFYLHRDASYCFESIRLSVQKKQKIDFQDGGHLGFPISSVLAIFDLQVTLMLPTKFPVNWSWDVKGIGF